MKYKLYIITFTLFLASCTSGGDEFDESKTGLRPVYMADIDLHAISSEAPKVFDRVGKIYQYGQYIFVSDKGTGVHIINNSDPSNPVKEAFINVPRSFDMLARLNALYADNGTDLVAIDITDITNAFETARITNVYRGVGDSYPPFYNGPFECVDETKGTVIDWEEADLINPQCFR